MADLMNTLLFRQIMREQDNRRRVKAEADEAADRAAQFADVLAQRDVATHKEREGRAMQMSGMGMDVQPPELQEAARMGAMEQRRMAEAAAAKRAMELEDTSAKYSHERGLETRRQEGALDVEGLRQTGASTRYDLTNSTNMYLGDERNKTALEVARINADARRAAARETGGGGGNPIARSLREVTQMRNSIINELRTLQANQKVADERARYDGKMEQDFSPQMAKLTAKLRQLDAFYATLSEQMGGGGVTLGGEELEPDDGGHIPATIEMPAIPPRPGQKPKPPRPLLPGEQPAREQIIDEMIEGL
jgi:hypothetical protein